MHNIIHDIGMTMQIGQQYSVTFPKKIHLSTLILREDVYYFDCKVEVHVVEPNGNDQLIGLLGGYNNYESLSTSPILVCNPDLNLAAGVPFTFYISQSQMGKRPGFTIGVKKFSSSPATTQLTGYFID